MDQPLISICIPAYKKPQFVVRLLDSVVKQTYKHVEVIISDDSPDESIKIVIQPYIHQLTIKYYHNQPALRSPANWNAALDKARGDLKVLMHQDDWYHSHQALEMYVKTFNDDNTLSFVFCQNTAIDESGRKLILQARPSLPRSMHLHPNHLLLAQVIGPPSNTMIRAGINIRYDERFIWLVDVDYYVRLLKQGHKYKYLEQHLVSIGLHEDQTTVFCRTNNTIILKENIWFAGKLEPQAFKDVRIYDYYWRLLRNYAIRTEEDIVGAGVVGSEIPHVIKHILHWQKRLPLSVLKFGAVSKVIMFISWVVWNK